jgi:hypothetical protein
VLKPVALSCLPERRYFATNTSRSSRPPALLSTVSLASPAPNVAVPMKPPAAGGGSWRRRAQEFG